MKIVEIYLNIIHYCIFKTLFSLTLIFKKLIGSKSIHSEALGINKYLLHGIDLSYAGGFMIGIVFFDLMIIIHFFKGFMKIYDSTSIIIFALAGLVSIIISYYLIFKKEKYLNYFEAFDKSSSRAKKVYYLLTISSILLTCFLFVYSLRY